MFLTRPIMHSMYIPINTSHQHTLSHPIPPPLESAIMASKDNRACYVLAFSGGNDVAEYDGGDSVGGKTKGNLLRLLDFLGSSFQGGTDGK